MKYTIKNIEPKIIKFEEDEIAVKQSLSTNDIYDLVEIVMQESKEGILYNPIKLDVMFYVNLVMMITDVKFEAEDRLNKFETYDALVSSGIMEKIIMAFPKDEFDKCRNYLIAVAENEMKYGQSAGAVIRSVIADLPTQAEAVAKIIEDFNPEKYQAVIDFATAANGNRPIPMPN